MLVSFYYIILFVFQLHIFFDTSMEFVAEYSMISEIYSSIFSLLVTLCIVSSLDKYGCVFYQN